MERLNEAQREMVSVNHNLIYKLESKYHLDHETYYDILAIGLCKAALTYKENPINKFSTFACRVMLNEAYEWYRCSFMLKKNSGERKTISYDTSFFNNEEEKLIDHMGSYPEMVYEEVAYKIMVSELQEKFKRSNHKEIVRMLCLGFPQKVIGDKFNVSSTAVYLINKKLREVYKASYGAC